MIILINLCFLELPGIFLRVTDYLYERSVIAEFQFDPIRVFLERTMYKQNPSHKKQKAQIGPSTKLVAGVRFELTTFGL